MSIEFILVFALSSPPSAVGLQSALDRQGIPIHMSQSGAFQEHSGFIPVDYEARKSGFEVSQLTYQDLTSSYPGAKIPGGTAKAIISLGWGGDFLECASVLQVASVLVSEFGATAFDTESGRFMPLGDLRGGAAACYEESRKQPAPR